MDWIDLDQDKDRWRVLENTVFNLRVPYNTRNFLLAKIRLAPQGLCSMEL